MDVRLSVSSHIKLWYYFPYYYYRLTKVDDAILKNESNPLFCCARLTTREQHSIWFAKYFFAVQLSWINWDRPELVLTIMNPLGKTKEFFRNSVASIGSAQSNHPRVPSKFKRKDYAILALPAALCFVLWVRQQDQKRLAPIRKKKERDHFRQ